MSNLTVSEINGELVIDSRLIADELGIHPEILSSTVEKHLTKFQRFGVIRSGTDISSKWYWCFYRMCNAFIIARHL